VTEGAIAPAYALAHIAPDYWASLSDAEQLVAAFDFSLWLRPDQRVPEHDFGTFGCIGGRGWGKSHCLAYAINQRIERGDARSIALMAPNDDRVKEVQADFLVAMSPPWFQAEHYAGGVRWPNGVVATAFTPEAPGRPRSGNFDLSWACEIVDWQASTRAEAFSNLNFATRVGKAQIFWDTTSKGKNEVIQALVKQSESDPVTHILRRGTTFDNPLLSRKYLRRVYTSFPVGTRRHLEELYGQVFAESAGALWEQAWIDDYRRAMAPSDPEITIVGLDPALSASGDADETGILVACRDRLKEYYVLRDLSGRLAPETWAAIVVDECARGASGVVVERNHAGDMPRDLLKVHGARKGMAIRVLGKSGDGTDEPFPRARPGVIHVREVTSTKSKETRASAPASLYHEGRVHHVGTFDLLELEQTTWEPGKSRSPNRLDALAQAINELAEIRVDERVDGRAAVATAAAAQKLLLAGLANYRGGRRVGL
jgi:phage terminase large subunit-like protein